MYTFSRSTETSFACVTVNKVEFPPHDNSSARLLTLMNCKCAVFETKVISILREEPKTFKLKYYTYIGKILSLSLSLGRVCEFPYMNTFLPVEWPWKSQKKKISLDSYVFFIISFVW